MTGTSYAQAALRSEADALREAPEGSRALAAFRCAARIGGLVGAGALAFEEAFAALEAAAIAAGLQPKEAAGHVGRGLAEGMKSPRDLSRIARAERTPGGRRSPARPPAPRPAVPPFAYPPPGELEALWRATTPTSQDEETAAYLTGRGIDPLGVDDLGLARSVSELGLTDFPAHELGLARALPRGARVPSFARAPGGFWTASGHRLLIPTFDAAGRMVSVRARYVGGEEIACEQKEVAPWGYQIRGSVFACGWARLLLRGWTLDYWGPRRVLVIVEGGPDFLTWAGRVTQMEDPAVIGIFAGAWTDQFAARVPETVQVALRTHRDAAGDCYAKRIAESFRGRCEVFDFEERSV